MFDLMQVEGLNVAETFLLLQVLFQYFFIWVNCESLFVGGSLKFPEEFSRVRAAAKQFQHILQTACSWDSYFKSEVWMAGAKIWGFITV